MTNPEPIVIPTPSRPARIAALHAAGLFLAEHIDLPMPATVHMHAHDLTWDQLTAVADLHRATIEYGTDTAWCSIPVTLETLYGIEIEYTAFSRDLPQTTPMDLPPRVGVVLPEQDTDPWEDVMPATPRPRCEARWKGARCAHPAGHPSTTLHFYDDDETNGAHGA